MNRRMVDLDALRYPVGKFQRLAAPLDAATRRTHIKTIEDTPATFRSLTAGLTDAQLETRYRPGGWTIRQLVHHVADSHMNAYVRMKLAATEDRPTVKTYHEELWAELPEAKSAPVETSLALIEALHERLMAFLRALPPETWRRIFLHPEWGEVSIDECITLYSWHCRHHTAHIKQALNSRSN